MVDIESFREFCLSLKGTSEGFPFGEDTLVFYVAGKMFALTDLNLFASVNLKCDPEEAIDLRERYSAVKPGYHMNKQHWNTVEIDGSIPDAIIRTMIINSYKLVVQKLPKKERDQLL